MSESTTPERTVTRIPAVDPEVVRNRDLSWRELKHGKSGVQAVGSGLNVNWELPRETLQVVNYLMAQQTDSVYRKRYRKAFGTIPANAIVHHFDGDRSNNEVENLRCLTPTQHSALHHRIRKGEAAYCDDEAVEQARKDFPAQPR